jgi:hypothetical protein
MNVAVRRGLSALGIAAFVVFALGGAVSAALSLREAKAHVAELDAQVQALTISEPDMQALLYDLETGRPYLFVDAFEARAPEATSEPGAGAMRVSLTVSGQWSEAK